MTIRDEVHLGLKDLGFEVFYSARLYTRYVKGSVFIQWTHADSENVGKWMWFVSLKNWWWMVILTDVEDVEELLVEGMDDLVVLE